MKVLVIAGVIGVLALAAVGGPARAGTSQASVRFAQTVPGQPGLDIAVVGGPVLVRDLTYPTTSPFIRVAPGTYNIEIRPTGTSTVLVRILGWHAVAGASTTVRIILGADGHLDVSPMADLPNTGAETGLLATAGAALIALGGALMLTARRALT